MAKESATVRKNSLKIAKEHQGVSEKTTGSFLKSAGK